MRPSLSRQAQHGGGRWRWWCSEQGKQVRMAAPLLPCASSRPPAATPPSWRCSPLLHGQRCVPGDAQPLGLHLRIVAVKVDVQDDPGVVGRLHSAGGWPAALQARRRRWLRQPAAADSRPAVQTSATSVRSVALCGPLGSASQLTAPSWAAASSNHTCTGRSFQGAASPISSLCRPQMHLISSSARLDSAR